MTEIKGKTQSGFEYTIDIQKLDNYEFLEAVSKVEIEGNVLYLPIVLQMMLGDQVNALKEHLRNEDGRITNESLIQEVKDIFSEQESLKKSQPSPE